MEPLGLQTITAAVAPVVMVSAAGLLFMAVQTKNLHLADRLRALMGEYRSLPPDPAHQARREQIVAQLGLFQQRIRLSQRALELLYLAMVCFVLTSLLLVLASGVRLGRLLPPAVILVIFVLGVGFLLGALLLEFLELRVGLKTIEIETEGVRRSS